MALIPQPINRFKPLAGFPGGWANMELTNAETKFAEDDIPYGQPVADGATPDGAVLLEDGEVFIGFALANVYSTGDPTDAGDGVYAEGDKFGVAKQGTVFVRIGANVSRGQLVYWDPTTGLHYGTPATGRILLPGTAFDDAGTTAGQVAPVRIIVVPGEDAVEDIT